MTTQPYLTFVATSRNDNHGGDMLLRMQTFVDALCASCDRWQLPVELLLVEWNPPADRPPLADALTWPASQFCECRIVTVTPELHRRYPVCGEEMPLFQMIAKNVGIRRARGEFVLATNVDILFSDELMQWLATRPLQAGVSYRVDRYDVPLEVMQEAGLVSQLRFCRRNVLRVNSRYGTFPGSLCAPPEPEPEPEPPPTLAVSLSGAPDAPPPKPAPKRIRKPLRKAAREKLRAMIWADQRLLCGLHRAQRHWSRSCWHARGFRRTGSVRHAFRAAKYAAKSAVRMSRVGTRLAIKGTRAVVRTLSDAKVFTALRRISWPRRTARARDDAAASTTAALPTTSEPAPPPLPRLRPAKPVPVHTNACGDFTLLARSDWERLRGYVEWDIFSWHLDSLFLFCIRSAGIREEIRDEAIYHIEHTGGWTPESAERLFARLRAKSIPFLTNEDLATYERQILVDPRPRIFNGETWGLADCDLTDIRPTNLSTLAADQVADERDEEVTAAVPFAGELTGRCGLEVLRKKWCEVPFTRMDRACTCDLLKLSDDELLVAWHEALASQVEGEHFNARGWAHTLYREQFRGKKVMDVGSGLGYDGLTFARHGAAVTFVDIVPENLQFVERLARLFGLRDCRFHYLEDFASLDRLDRDYDVIWAWGSLINAPYDFTKAECSRLLEHLRVGGRWMELGYPKVRWEREGRLPFHRWGDRTDGGAPWIEWKDLEKVRTLLEPGRFDVVLNFEFHDSDFNWFDLHRAA